MLDKLNPFKKHSHNKEQDNGLAPTKSSKSFAGSVRSLGDKAEHLFQDGPRPHEIARDKQVSGNLAIPAVTTSGGPLGPTMSPGLR